MISNSSSLLSLALLLGGLVGMSVGCEGGGIGSPCATIEDCDGELVCDIHDGQGTCQEEHGHGTPVGCDAETRDEEFFVGLSKTGTFVTASFVSADPAPPSRGDNTWVLSFADSEGEPLDGLDIEVSPMMPDHGHGTSIVAEVNPTGVAGEYTLAPVNMFMVGYWEITLDVTLGDQHDEIMFRFCVE